MRGLVLSFLLVGSVGFVNQAKSEMVCIPGPAMSCVDLQFVAWTQGATPQDFGGHSYYYWFPGFSGVANFNPSHGMIIVAFEQPVAGSNVLCRSTAYPYDGVASGAGPLPCIFTVNLNPGMVAGDGSFFTGGAYRFFETTSPFTTGPVGSPVSPLDPPQILGLAAFNWGNAPGADSPPDAACGGGFFGAWLETVDAGGPCQVVSNAVPEPSTVILLGTGLLGLGFVAWRRKEDE